MPADNKTKKTILTLNQNKQKGIKTVLVTAYDYPQSRIADSAGVDCILVGDSLGMVLQGHDSTIPVTMEDIIYHMQCVKRGNQGKTTQDRITPAITPANWPMTSDQTPKPVRASPIETRPLNKDRPRSGINLRRNSNSRRRRTM